MTQALDHYPAVFLAFVGTARPAKGFVLPWETMWGKVLYTNDPADPGGETKYGISKRSYPALDIAALTEPGAIAIYFRDYWHEAGLHKSFCNRFAWPLNVVHFDCCVNVGNWKTTKAGAPLWHGRANMILQRALGTDDDGDIGPMTRSAVRLADPRELALDAIAQRQRYYDSLGAWADPYRGGWRNRLRALLRYIEPAEAVVA